MAKKQLQRMTPEQIDKMLFNERLKVLGLTIFFAWVGAGIFVLMLTPLARSIAGTHTDFNLNVSLAINLTLAVTTVVGGAAAIELNRRRRHHQKRARELETQLIKLKGKKQVTKGRGL